MKSGHDMNAFDGQVVMITGGGAGIGRSAALMFAGRGATVVVTGRLEAPLQELASHHPQVDYIVADVAVAEGI